MTASTKTTAKPEVRTRLTAAKAQAQGLVPAGFVFDEETQQPVERGFALERAQLERPTDLALQLESWEKNRATLVAFVKKYLEEASYDKKGYPVPGQVRDYYTVPGAQTKALTKRGGEKLANLFRFGKATTTVVAHTETKEYVSATVEVTLVDQYRRPIGSAVSSCSTAESGFASPRARAKYENDYRAALNDVVARAAKRAFVQAVIVAAAADEMFTGTVADEDAAGGEQAAAAAPPADPGPFLPKTKALKQYAGQSVRALPADALATLARVLTTQAKHPQVWAPVVAALGAELERRELELRDDEDELPL
jgi:hypothetical protein